ncbi:MAG: fasciclin domain-containing protein, partial [Flavobacteriales bacterium]|nr:fasciclin domain-containing protein [Flavobacteriales bacterium]
TISAGTVATNLDGNPLQFNVLDNGTISVIGLNNTVNITVTDVFTYNGVLHVVDAVLSTKIAPLEGTCGTWTLELQNNFGSGWDDSYLYVQVNEETIDNVTILQGNSTTFEFAVNQGDVVNLIYNGDAYGHAYALFDEDNTIIVQANGDANGDIASYNGLIACQPANNSEFYCGDFTVELYNDMGYGWVYSSLDVYRNGIFESALEMPTGYGPLITSISAIYNDSFDFVVNSLLQFPEEIGGYKIRSQTGGILVNENYVNQGPQNAFDIVICESESGLSIEESSGKEARLVKMIDVLGKVQNEHLNGVLLFYVFDNGRVEKRFKQ